MTSGSSLGQVFRITSFGESHGKALGVVIDGCPAGLKLDLAQVQGELDRRRPGQSKFVTPRKELDQVEFLSGVFEGETTGAPIMGIVYNHDVKSKDYSEIKDLFRPGHADFTYFAKYGGARLSRWRKIVGARNISAGYWWSSCKAITLNDWC